MITWDLTQKTPTDSGNDVRGENGSIKIATDIEALRIRIDAALQIVKGELEDPNEGVDYFGIILTNAPIQMKVQELCRVINKVDGVLETLFDGAEFDAQTKVLTMHFTIHSVYGDINYTKEV